MRWAGQNTLDEAGEELLAGCPRGGSSVGVEGSSTRTIAFHGDKEVAPRIRTFGKGSVAFSGGAGWEGSV